MKNLLCYTFSDAPMKHAHTHPLTRLGVCLKAYSHQESPLVPFLSSRPKYNVFFYGLVQLLFTLQSLQVSQDFGNKSTCVQSIVWIIGQNRLGGAIR